MMKTASISACGKYRFWLTRGQDSSRRCVFIMLNPSTADGFIDDPTIRRCLAFAKREQATQLIVVNLFTLRSPSPKDLLLGDDPVGPDADSAIERAIQMCDHDNQPIICAWGRPKGPSWFLELHKQRRAFVAAKAGSIPLYALGLTKDNHPKHPLYLPSDAPLKRFKP